DRRTGRAPRVAEAASGARRGWRAMTGDDTLLVLLVLLPVVAFAIGWLLGRRRVHALALELATMTGERKSAADLARERDHALDLALERLRGGFDAAAGEALRGNSEVFLQLARQVLGQQQELAVRSLGEREKAVEAMLTPVREALSRTHEQIARIEKERAESF